MECIKLSCSSNDLIISWAICIGNPLKLYSKYVFKFSDSRTCCSPYRPSSGITTSVVSFSNFNFRFWIIVYSFTSSLISFLMFGTLSICDYLFQTTNSSFIVSSSWNNSLYSLKVKWANAGLLFDLDLLYSFLISFSI